ncbi:hypothetical protein GCM10011575_31440 [Microlunatus endophyticus]|uniref:DUF4352 domain-containing protein n=1 Tax=Microlunatus endophyticus TaxID=1716077 RepID=A0A917SE15_9ACTN|nr:hypothetical protein [Microlunatus endophyticus]GGL70662.1 hypothetical protein GCM10011575_31440 [Microlunatus endophyticus]
MSASTQQRPTDRVDKLIQRSDRRRSWLMASMAFALVLIYLFIWMTYAGSHTYSRFRQLPAGDSATVKGVTFTLVSLTRTGVITDGDETHQAQPGTTYVIADLQIVTANKDPLCSVELVADGKRTWESNAEFFDRKKPQYCGDDEHPVTPGKPWDYEQIYLIPAAFADRLYGIGVEDLTSPAPTKVLTPAA